ncbi:MAG TPA: hypothetical protein VJT69_02945 [Pyrinomonadaceae bacterium]|nr:hypothetical protein [Pyrinomonadaceae bacterium]
MLTRNQYLLCTLLVCFVASTGLAQTSITEFQKVLAEKASFQESDFAALQANQSVVRLAPVSDKREIAVAGLVNIRSGADEFLRSYRDSMLRKSNGAILEIGSFGSQPALTDLESLTLESGDIEDLKDCVVGDCDVKLSAAMIDRFRREIDWNAPDYALKVTGLFKQMLSEYVRDYRTRGDAALIQYHDKRDEIDLASEQRALSGAAGYTNSLLADSNAGLRLIEDAIVWSKIKFGLKPVIAVNHITIYKRDREVGPQVLIASKQIYASHYFNASLALTAFVTVPGATQGAFLVSENRSRADGLEGPFGKIKRGVVEKKALEGLKSILEHSQMTLEGSTLAATTADLSSHEAYNWDGGWGQRLFGGVRPLLWLLVLSALIALLVLGKRRVDSASAPKNKTLKPESAKS